MSPSYTPQQMKVMVFVHEYLTKNGMSPTLDEIGEHLGIHRVSAHGLVKAVIAKGGIVKDKKHAVRNIRVVDPFVTRSDVKDRYIKTEKHVGHQVRVGKYENGHVVVYCDQCNDIIYEETPS